MPLPKTKAELCKLLTDLLLFYTTAFFVLLAIGSLFALIFLVPFFVDPAWSTLQADFDAAGTNCTTVSGVYKEGKSQCEWSSCEEGCTKTIYTCWQIEVEYPMAGVNTQPGVPVPVRRGQLFPNVKGCGYPPRVVCSDFIAQYSVNGTTFPCFASRTDPKLVVVDLDLQQIHAELFYSLAVPVPCLVVACIYIVIAYIYIYKDQESMTYRPIATLSAASAMAALIDVKGVDATAADDDERQRRKLLLQAQRARLLAAQGKSSAVAGVMIRTAMAASAAGAMQHLHVHEHAAKSSVAPAAPVGLDAKLEEKDDDQQKADNAKQFEKVQKFRNEYGQEKYNVMQYYHYYGII